MPALARGTTLMCGGILVFPSLKEFEELLGSSFLKDAHERTLDGLHLCTGNLGNSAIAVDKTPRNLLKLKIPGDIGMDKDFGEFS
jgi:hypothetical protein